MSEPAAMTRPAVETLTDDELHDEVREHVNNSRYRGGYDRPRFRAIFTEANRRGWNLGKDTSKPL